MRLKLYCESGYVAYVVCVLNLKDRRISAAARAKRVRHQLPSLFPSSTLELLWDAKNEDNAVVVAD